MDSEKTTLALQYHEAGYNCAQAVFSAFSEDFGLDSTTSRKISSCFGGGMRRGATCGALSGALMVLGLAMGFGEMDEAHKACTEELCKILNAEWKEEIGALDCNHILGIDVGDPIQKQMAKESGIFARKCPGCIRTGVRLLEETLTKYQDGICEKLIITKTGGNNV